MHACTSSAVVDGTTTTLPNHVPPRRHCLSAGCRKRLPSSAEGELVVCRLVLPITCSRRTAVRAPTKLIPPCRPCFVTLGCSLRQPPSCDRLVSVSYAPRACCAISPFSFDHTCWLGPARPPLGVCVCVAGNALDEYTLPEMLRVPLDETILQVCLLQESGARRLSCGGCVV
jgi:hypothetical protein